MSRDGGAVANAFTVDLEDWYQGLEIDPDQWDGFEDRLHIGTHALLDLLDESDTKATFFVLGYAAERAPQLVREIWARGHEIGTHGYGHRLVYTLTPEEFRRDLQRSLEVLDKIVGQPVLGHRAPFFSITKKAQWAFEVLRECGLDYDSSVFPVHNYRYGIADAPRSIYPLGGGLWEFPLSTHRIWRYNIPTAGGAYFRLFPYTFTSYTLRKINASGRPGVFYIHPWELDPNHPRLPLPGRIRLTHYWNLTSTQKRLKRLLASFNFTTMGQVLKEQSPHLLDQVNI